MAEPNEVDQLLDQMLKGKTPEEILRKDGVLKVLTKRLVERALEGELTSHLGYEKHATAGRRTGNSRNGTTAKHVLTGAGELHIEVQRDRDFAGGGDGSAVWRIFHKPVEDTVWYYRSVTEVFRRKGGSALQGELERQLVALEEAAGAVRG